MRNRNFSENNNLRGYDYDNLMIYSWNENDVIADGINMVNNGLDSGKGVYRLDIKWWGKGSSTQGETARREIARTFKHYNTPNIEVKNCAANVRNVVELIMYYYW